MTTRIRTTPNQLARTATRHPWLLIACWLVAIGVCLWPQLADRFEPDTNVPVTLPAQQTDPAALALICANAEQTIIWEGISGDVAAMSAVAAATISDGLGQCYLSIWQDVPFDQLALAETIDQTDERTLTTLAIIPDALQSWFAGQHASGVLQRVEHQAQSDILRAERVALPIAWLILLAATRNLGKSLIPLVAGATTSIVGVTFATEVLDPPVAGTFAISIMAMLGLALGIDYGLYAMLRSEAGKLRPIHHTIWVAALVVTSGALSLLVIPVATVQFLAVGLGVMALIAALVATTLAPALTAALPSCTHRHRPHTAEPAAAGSRSPSTPVRKQQWKFVLALGLAAVLLFLGSQAFRLDAGLTSLLATPGEAGTTETFPTFAAREATQVQMSTLSVSVPAGDVTIVSRLVTAVGSDEDFAPFVLREQSPGSDRVRLFLLAVHPWEDERTQAAIQRLRHEVLPSIAESSGLNLRLEGPLLVYTETLDLLERWQTRSAGLAMVCSLATLWILQRNGWLATFALAGTCLSCAAALGALVTLAERGWFGLFQPIEAWVPVVIVCLLIGLGMDYHVFLTSDTGRTGTRRVVIASAAIMIVVFGGFLFAQQMGLRQVGIGLAIGVAIDAFIVRLIIYPAILPKLANSS